MLKRKVIITGAKGLIGSALTNYLSSINWEVIDIDIDDFDLSLPKQAELMCQSYFDVPNLINCFAFNDHVKSFDNKTRHTVLDIDSANFADIMNLNVTSLFNVCRNYASVRLGRGGNIINFGASTGIVTARTDMYNGNHKNIAYSVSKAAVIHMTKILATHLLSLDKNFRVNCISPGGIEADQGEEFQVVYGSHTPKGRMLHVEELFPVVDMLLDDRNVYMQGANIVVDGGWTIQ